MLDVRNDLRYAEDLAVSGTVSDGQIGHIRLHVLLNIGSILVDEIVQAKDKAVVVDLKQTGSRKTVADHVGEIIGSRETGAEGFLELIVDDGLNGPVNVEFLEQDVVDLLETRAIHVQRILRDVAVSFEQDDGNRSFVAVVTGIFGALGRGRLGLGLFRLGRITGAAAACAAGKQSRYHQDSNEHAEEFFHCNTSILIMYPAILRVRIL